MFYIKADELKLAQWEIENSEDVSVAIDSLQENKSIMAFINKLAIGLVKYDWRTANAPGLSDDQKTSKLAFRGSGGYKELRRQLLKLLTTEAEPIGRAAKEIIKALGY